MKLRIIEKDGYFYPQFFGKNRYDYTKNWKHFLCDATKSIRFTKLPIAQTFLECVEQSVEVIKSKKPSQKVVYQNYEGEV